MGVMPFFRYFPLFFRRILEFSYFESQFFRYVNPQFSVIRTPRVSFPLLLERNLGIVGWLLNIRGRPSPSQHSKMPPGGAMQEFVYPTIATVMDLPIEEQAKYADHICVSSAQDLEFCRDQLPTGDPCFRMWNATSFGNVAFLAVHGHEETRAAYAKLLEQARAYHKFAGACAVM